MTAPTVRAAIALAWRQLLLLAGGLGAAAEVTRAGEVVIYTGRDWPGVWVAG